MILQCKRTCVREHTNRLVAQTNTSGGGSGCGVGDCGVGGLGRQVEVPAAPELLKSAGFVLKGAHDIVRAQEAVFFFLATASLGNLLVPSQTCLAHLALYVGDGDLLWLCNSV